MIADLLKGMKIATHLRSGRGKIDPEKLRRQLESDACWAARNNASVNCAAKGWPQDDPNNRCFGNNNSIKLKECLYVPNLPNWWDSFPSCKGTSGKICYDNRLGGEWYTKCQNEHAARLEDKANWTEVASIQELGKCMGTIPE